MMAFIDQEANEKAEEIDAKVRLIYGLIIVMSSQICIIVVCLKYFIADLFITLGYILLFLNISFHIYNLINHSTCSIINDLILFRLI